MANRIGQNQKVLRGIQQSLRLEQNTGKRRGQKHRAVCARHVHQKHGIVYMPAPVAVRLTEHSIVYSQFGQHFAVFESEILCDVVTFPDHGRGRRGLTEHRGEATQNPTVCTRKKNNDSIRLNGAELFSPNMGKKRAEVDFNQRPNTFAQPCLSNKLSLAVARRTIHSQD